MTEEELKKIEQKPDTDFSDLRTWKYIVDAVWTEKEGIGNYLDSPFTEEVAKKLQKRFGNIKPKQEWSVEDEKKFSDILAILRCGENCYYNSPILIDWLKSLKENVQPQPKQEWSEKDGAVLDALIRRFEGEDVYVSPHLAVECLKSIKDRVQPKQEWSEEDEYHKRQILRILKDNGCSQTLQEKTEKWIEERLKSLRPQKQWKPRDEQIKVCKEVYADLLSAKGFDLGTINSELNRLEEELRDETKNL